MFQLETTTKTGDVSKAEAFVTHVENTFSLLSEKWNLLISDTLEAP